MNPLLIGIAAIAAVVVLLIVVNPLGWGREVSPSGDARAQAQQQVAAPATFEEYLVSQNTLDSFCGDLRNGALAAYPLLGGQMVDVQVDVQGNQVSVVLIVTPSSTDSGYFSNLLGALSAEASNEMFGNDENMADTIGSWEQNSGIDGITLHYEMRYSDGGLFWSHDYSSVPSS